MRRTSHALIIGSALWLIDPVDVGGLDATLATDGAVAGVILTVARHRRDAAAIAARHGASVWADAALGTRESNTRAFRERLPGTPLLSLPLPGRGLRRWWREAAVFWPEERIVVVGESVGNPPYYLLDGETIGLHPVRRGQPPEELAGLDVDRLLCGHGDGVGRDAAPALRELIHNGPGRRSPLWMLRTLRAYRS